MGKVGSGQLYGPGYWLAEDHGPDGEERAATAPSLDGVASKTRGGGPHPGCIDEVNGSHVEQRNSKKLRLHYDRATSSLVLEQSGLHPRTRGVE
ncbi:hypothetical protein NDU88_005608 [Pleurodeles waltl]|uniref:Uncharacterized protein n=1 Tax=Pleurodeles waltl TaxID=8319 RepID=A0AAV7SM59_PLEWA|nr:hypothetical protein NDU88_005608 [Pleurodeles waltl]